MSITASLPVGPARIVASTRILLTAIVVAAALVVSAFVIGRATVHAARVVTTVVHQVPAPASGSGRNAGRDTCRIGVPC
jgi:hypothetical protein